MFLDRFKGVVFDLDGVLVDTEYYQWQGWVEVLKPYGISFSKEEYFNYAGKNGVINEDQLRKKYNVSANLLKEKEKLILKWLEEKPIKPMFFSKNAIDFFKKKKFKIAIGSSGYKEEILIKLRKTKIDNFFDCIVSNNDAKRGKPYPDIYLKAAEKLGLRPEECIAFEDTQYGVQSAKDAGLYCIAVPNEFSIKQDFSRADKVFNNLEQAVNWLG